VVRVVGEARAKANIGTANPDQKLENLLANTATSGVTWRSKCWYETEL
jgi:hypothetical protein